MSKTVFILGAGASKDSGAPLMDEFLNESDKLNKSGKIEEIFKDDFKRVSEAMNTLDPIYAKANVDFENIEKVYSLFEMGRYIKKLPGMNNPEEIGKIIDSLRVLIFETLDKTITIKMKENDKLCPDGSYGDFVSLLKSIKNQDGTFPSIISFNYDLALDCALFYNDYQVNYCFDNNNGDIKLMKLHGSLNWFKSKDSNEIIPYDFSEINKWYRNLPALDVYNEKVNISLTKKFTKEKISYKGKELQPIPIIIPPTWNKLEFSYNLKIAEVWQKAAKELSDAENIFVIGYSYPETDNFFKYFYALAILGTSSINRFWVFNPDQLIKRKFFNLLGPRVKRSYKFEPKRFSEAIEFLKEIFK